MGTMAAAYTTRFLDFGFAGNKTKAKDLTSTGLTMRQSTFGGSGKLRHSRSTSTSYTGYRCRSQLVEDFAPAASAVYGALLLGGGLFAYTKSGSKGSLFGGLTGATLMSAAYYLMQAHETQEIGDAIAFGAALLFAAVFGIRFAATRKLVPSGLLLGISIGFMAVAASAYLQQRI